MADTNKAISSKDRNILRELAKKQLECANSPLNLDIISRWYAHNARLPGRPMIHIELGSFADDFVPERMRCEGEIAREIEAQVLGIILNRELFGDDRPIPPHLPVAWRAQMIPFGIEIGRRHASDADGRSLGYEFIHPITDLEVDFDKLGESRYEVDREGTLSWIDTVNEAIGDILPPKLTGRSIGGSPTQMIVRLMGMETMFTSMYDCPGLFHRMMGMYARDLVGYFRFLERERLMLPTAGDEILAQGSFCYNKELADESAAKDRGLLSTDLWGYVDSQETVGVSPEMFHEFIFPYYKLITSQFGLLSYGCCEPVHSFWDMSLSKLNNMRKISISAWCDEEMMGERLRGRGVIYLRKPSPLFIGTSSPLDEDALRGHIRRTVAAARGMTLEFSQRDVYTVGKDAGKVRRFVEIVREESEAHRP